MSIECPARYRNAKIWFVIPCANAFFVLPGQTKYILQTLLSSYNVYCKIVQHVPMKLTEICFYDSLLNFKANSHIVKRRVSDIPIVLLPFLWMNLVNLWLQFLFVRICSCNHDDNFFHPSILKRRRVFCCFLISWQFLSVRMCSCSHDDRGFHLPCDLFAFGMWLYAFNRTCQTLLNRKSRLKGSLFLRVFK